MKEEMEITGVKSLEKARGFKIGASKPKMDLH